jgi:hypothetical protein
VLGGRVGGDASWGAKLRLSPPVLQRCMSVVACILFEGDDVDKGPHVPPGIWTRDMPCTCDAQHHDVQAWKDEQAAAALEESARRAARRRRIHRLKGVVHVGEGGFRGAFNPDHLDKAFLDEVPMEGDMAGAGAQRSEWGRPVAGAKGLGRGG